MLLATNVLLEATELLCQRQKDLILVIDRVLQEGNQFLARAIRTKREGDGRDAVNGIQAKLHVFRAQLVHQNRDGGDLYLH